MTLDLVDSFIAAKPKASEFADQLIQEMAAAEVENRAAGTATNQAPVSDFSATSPPPVILPPDTSPPAPKPMEFDPAIHCVDSAGNPRRNQDGSYRKKRGKKSAYATASPTSPVQVDATRATFDLQCKNAATMTVQGIVAIGCAFGGAEGAPTSEELFAMHNAFEDYYRIKGPINFPAWIGVAVAVGAYAVPRCSKPVTKTRLKAVWNWTKPKMKASAKWLFSSRAPRQSSFYSSSSSPPPAVG